MATVSIKGQITIPAPVREALHVKTGDRVEFVEIEPGRYELIAASRPITALKGMFGKPTHRSRLRKWTLSSQPEELRQNNRL